MHCKKDTKGKGKMTSMNFKLEVRVYLKIFLSYHANKLYGLLDKITKDDAKTIKSFLMGLDTVILPSRYHCGRCAEDSRGLSHFKCSKYMIYYTL